MADSHQRPTLRQTTPVFLVADIGSTMRWYSNALGFKTRPVPESAPHHFCILTRDNITIFLQQLAVTRSPISTPDVKEACGAFTFRRRAFGSCSASSHTLKM